MESGSGWYGNHGVKWRPVAKKKSLREKVTFEVGKKATHHCCWVGGPISSDIHRHALNILRLGIFFHGWQSPPESVGIPLASGRGNSHPNLLTFINPQVIQSIRDLDVVTRFLVVATVLFKYHLGGGLKYLLFSPWSLGKISILTHIFQMGWFNHQLAGVFPTWGDL